jgi:hypothetical protein
MRGLTTDALGGPVGGGAGLRRCAGGWGGSKLFDAAAVLIRFDFDLIVDVRQ